MKNAAFRLAGNLQGKPITWVPVDQIKPAQLESIVENAILSTIDIDAYNHEIEREEADSRFLEARRRLIMEYAASLPSN
jgi:hypothetical protein